MESFDFESLSWQLSFLIGLVVVATPALLLIFLKSKKKPKADHPKEVSTPKAPTDRPSLEDSSPEPAKAAPKKEEKAAPRKDLKEALQNTKSNIFGRIKSVFTGEKTLGEDELEELEEILYTSDIGPSTVQKLVESISSQLESEEKASFDKVREALKQEMNRLFSDVETTGSIKDLMSDENLSTGATQVWMIVGVNGAGKTTTIGKLANALTQKSKKVLIVAGDTFRAAAEDQLKAWAGRANVEIFSPPGVKDPSAVAFDALNLAKSKAFDYVIIDTAGRLHTQDNLMEELKKMKRVMTKVIPEAPQETFIVLDSNSGQNALMQTEKFNAAVGLTGAILTKLDGSAKGGVALGLASEHKLPIRLIGVGEGIEDLRSFNYKEFVDSII